MLEQPTQENELTAEQRRNLGYVYRIILGWRRDLKNKTVSNPTTESLSEEYPSLQAKPDSAKQTESGA